MPLGARGLAVVVVRPSLSLGFLDRHNASGGAVVHIRRAVFDGVADLTREVRLSGLWFTVTHAKIA